MAKMLRVEMGGCICYHFGTKKAKERCSHPKKAAYIEIGNDGLFPDDCPLKDYPEKEAER